MVLQALNGNYENVFLCAFTLILMLMPSLVQLEFRVELPKTLEIIILLFIFSAEILGEIGEFYLKVPNWGYDYAYTERLSGGRVGFL